PIPPFENKTGQPLLENDLTKKVIQDFIVDGRLKVVPAAQADAELDGTIQRYDRLVLTYSADSTQVPQQYKIQIAVDVDFTDLHTGKVLWTTRDKVNLTPGMEPDHNQFDSMNTSSLKEFTNYYVINVVGVPPEDEPTAQDRLLEQMASRVVQRTLDGF
ncbi:MAG TPA: LptE family protein, partial [bacterium]|nr:LptE family protein [bacterium]